jgi:hypothetical protein
MTTECIANLDIAERRAGPHAGRGEVQVTPTEWGLVAIVAVGFLLMLPAAAFLVSHLVA